MPKETFPESDIVVGSDEGEACGSRSGPPWRSSDEGRANRDCCQNPSGNWDQVTDVWHQYRVAFSQVKSNSISHMLSRRWSRWGTGRIALPPFESAEMGDIDTFARRHRPQAL